MGATAVPVTPAQAQVVACTGGPVVGGVGRVQYSRVTNSCTIDGVSGSLGEAGALTFQAIGGATSASATRGVSVGSVAANGHGVCDFGDGNGNRGPVGSCLVVGYADATDFGATFEWDSANPGAPVASDRRMNVVFRRNGSTITLTSASVQFIAVPPEINVTGNGQSITSGDATPTTADHTDFGSVGVSAAAGTRTFTIENTGAGALTLGANAVSVGGADAARFTVTAQPATSVAASGSTTFTVAFDPLINGAANATLSIANDDADENPYTFAITGTGTGGAPEINVTGNGITILSSDTMPQVADGTDFGNVNVDGGQVSRSFVIQNTGSADLNLGTVTLDSVGSFTITSNPANTTVAPGGTTTVTVRYDPDFESIDRVDLFIFNDDADESTYSFALQGTAINGTADIAVTGNGQTIASGDVNPSVVDHTDFGSTGVTGGQVARTYTLTNPGSANASLTGTPLVAISGAHAGDFSVTSQPANATISTFARTFVVRFDPSAAGLRTATVSIDNNVAGKNPYTFAIAGTGTAVPPEINVTGNGQTITSGDATPTTADHTDFGSVGVSAAAGTRTFTIENTGAGLLTLGANAVSVSGADAARFTVTAQPATSVAASGSTTFTVAFDPLINGAANATLSIANDDGDESPYTFAITGTGTGGAPEINVTGNGITILNGDNFAQVADGSNFGSAEVSGGQVSRNFIIQNTGTANLNLGVITITGPRETFWSKTSDPSNTTVAPGATATLTLQFDPAYEEVANVSVNIPNNDADEAFYRFIIQGTGINGTPDIAITGNSQTIAIGDATPSVADHTDFGSTDVTGGQVARTFTVNATGTSNVGLTGTPVVALAGAHAADF
ncbi:choice-of-anchor D domain-containing protein, partial [Pyruvatibacter sp.]|uniref:beta strand repeat-containing protein n=1 Tax=Pyruvatibacter sp. TaxID=1981328 RepID=UPI0032EE7C52